jgi:hypothetical protein
MVLPASPSSTIRATTLTPGAQAGAIAQGCDQFVAPAHLRCIFG